MWLMIFSRRLRKRSNSSGLMVILRSSLRKALAASGTGERRQWGRLHEAGCLTGLSGLGSRLRRSTLYPWFAINP